MALLWGVLLLIPTPTYILHLQELQGHTSIEAVHKPRLLRMTETQQGIDLVELILPLIFHWPNSNDQYRSLRLLLVSAAHSLLFEQVIHHLLHQLESINRGHSSSWISSEYLQTESRRTRRSFNRQRPVPRLRLQI